jgi:signal transduction histidine kinase
MPPNHCLLANRICSPGSQRTRGKQIKLPTSSPPHSLTLASSRDRLTALWYYSRHIHDDHTFVAHIQNILELAKDLIPCDCILTGLLDRDTYTTLASTDMAAMTWLRREAFCSHTIQRSCGDVHAFNDLKADDRFKGVPIIAEYDVASYWGVPLSFTFTATDGTSSQIAFGTICALKFGSPGEDISGAQKQSLARFSALIVHDIIERARLARAGDKHTMASRLAALSSEATHSNVEAKVTAALQETWPHAFVSIQHRLDDTIALSGTSPVPHLDFTANLYEDVAQVDALIYDFNHLPEVTHTTGRTLRAIAVKLIGAPHSYLVVQSERLSLIFDDIDIAFVQSCALLTATVRQAAELEHTTARAQFLRTLSHELRTPIHALLSSCELLVEDMKTLGRSVATEFSRDLSPVPEQALDHVTLLANAITSGRALLNTVNELLDIDALEVHSFSPSLFSLAALEATVLAHARTTILEQASSVQLVCEHLLPPDIHLLRSDEELLRQSLKILLDHVIKSISPATITLRTSMLTTEGVPDLLYEVIGTGPVLGPSSAGHDDTNPDLGIAMKVLDEGAQALGLLRAAKRMGGTLGGEVDSVPNEDGISFRLRLHAPGLASEIDHPSMRMHRSGVPSTYTVLGVGAHEAEQTPHLAAARRSLDACGLKEVQQDRAMIIVADAKNEDTLNLFGRMGASQLAVILHDAGEDDLLSQLTTLAQDAGKMSNLMLVSKPLGASRIWQSVGQVLDRFPRANLDRAEDVSTINLLPDAAGSSASATTPSDPSASASASADSDITINLPSTSKPSKPSRPRVPRILVVDDNVRPLSFYEPLWM